MIYHYLPTGAEEALCSLYDIGVGPQPDDVLVPQADIEDPGVIRWFNCADCHKVLSGGHKHMPMPGDPHA